MGHIATNRKKIRFKNTGQRGKVSLAIRNIKRSPWLYIMLVPGIIYFILFKYVPMWGVLIGFKDYSPYAGFLKSPWVGFSHFQAFFFSDSFWMLFGNTLWLAVLNLIFYFPLPIILSLMLNEVKKEQFKRIVQTTVYMPHFLSWVVIGSISYIFLTKENGIFNILIERLIGIPIDFLTSPTYFRPLILIQSIWKECGWGTILFLATLSGVDVALYEAATVDGANRWKQMWYITLPALRNTIIILLILRMGHFLETGFEQIFLMSNSMNRSVAEVFDTYVYNIGLLGGQFGYSTAIGLFKSVIGIILIFLTNRLAKRFGHEGIF